MGAHHDRLVSSSPVTHGVHPSPITESDIALNIASRREELHRNTPAAITLSAACVFGFHEEINGSLTTALRSRSESYAREQGTGKRALTWDDICELVIAGGSEGRGAVRALLAPVVAMLDGGGSGADVNEAAAAFVREAADVPNAFLLGRGDVEIDREIREAKEALRILEAARESRRIAVVCTGGRQ